MKMYDVTIKIRVSADNEEDAIRQALDILNSVTIKDARVEVRELGVLMKRKAIEEARK